MDNFIEISGGSYGLRIVNTYITQMKEDIARRRQYQMLGGYDNAVDRVISRLDVLIFKLLRLQTCMETRTSTMFPGPIIKSS